MYQDLSASSGDPFVPSLSSSLPRPVPVSAPPCPLSAPAQSKLPAESAVLAPVIRQLWDHEHGWIFHEPVDTKSWPDYTKFVKHPMDLGLVRRRLLQGRYSVRGGAESFAADVRLVFDNGGAAPSLTRITQSLYHSITSLCALQSLHATVSSRWFPQWISQSVLASEGLVVTTLAYPFHTPPPACCCAAAISYNEDGSEVNGWARGCRAYFEHMWCALPPRHFRHRTSAALPPHIPAFFRPFSSAIALAGQPGFPGQ